MSDSYLLPVSKSLVDAVVPLLSDGRSDYSRCIVVFPGKRPAQFLRKALVLRAGRSIIPPRIFSIDQFVDFLYHDILGLQERDLQPLDAVAVLYDLYLETPDRIGGESFRDLDAFLPLGLKLLQEFEEMHIARIPPGTLRDGLSVVTAGNPGSLHNLYTRFYIAVGARHSCTRSVRYRSVADWLKPEHIASYEKVIIAGFFALNSSERVILRTIGDSGNSVFLFQEGRDIRRHIQDLDMKPVVVAGEVPKPAIRFYRSPDSHGQVFGLSAVLEACNTPDAKLDERSVVVLPAPETLFPLLHQALSPFGTDEYNISLGYPVNRTPVYGFLSRMMESITSRSTGKFYAPAYLNFILHPYTKNILFEGRADVTRILFHAIEEDLAGKKSRTYFTLEDIEGDDPLLRVVASRLEGGEEATGIARLRAHLKEIHDNTIRRFLSIESVGHCARLCIDALLYLDDRSTARLHPLFRTYVEAIIASLEEVVNSLLGSRTFPDAGAYFSFLKRSISSASVPFPGTPLQGLQVLGLLETRNLKFDRVFMLDVTDDVIPGGASHDTLIPNKVRESLGLPTYRDSEAITAYHFDLLVRGAKEVHLFFTENGSKEKSRLVEKLLWDGEKNTDGGGNPVSNIRYNISLTNDTPSPIRKSDDVMGFLKTFTYTATALDAYLKCPLRFYYTFVLRLHEREEVSGEIERVDLGSFVHKVLSRYFRDKEGRELGAPDLDHARMERVVEETFREVFGEEKISSSYLLKRQVKRQLVEFLTGYQEQVIAKASTAILGTEIKVEGTRDGHTFRGFIDRVERRGDRIYILDYKTGSNGDALRVSFDKLDPNDRATWDVAVGSLQLPLYALLYAQRESVGLEIINPAYLMLGRNLMDLSIEVGLFRDEPVSVDKYEILDQIIRALVREISDPDIPFKPTQDLEKNCPSCPFTGLCGTQWAERWQMG